MIDQTVHYHPIVSPSSLLLIQALVRSQAAFDSIIHKFAGLLDYTVFQGLHAGEEGTYRQLEENLLEELRRM